MSHHILLQEKEDEAQQNLNGVTEILKFGASIVEGFIALMGQKVILSHFPLKSGFLLWIEQKIHLLIVGQILKLKVLSNNMAYNEVPNLL